MGRHKSHLRRYILLLPFFICYLFFSNIVILLYNKVRLYFVRKKTLLCTFQYLCGFVTFGEYLFFCKIMIFELMLGKCNFLISFVHFVLYFLSRQKKLHGGVILTSILTMRSINLFNNNLKVYFIHLLFYT